MNHSIYDRNELINKQENVAPNQQCKIAFLAEGVRQTVGSEVAVAQLASALGRLGFRVTICILRNEDRNSFQQSNPHVEVITLPSIEGRLLSKYIKAKALLPLIEKVNANIYVITSFSFIALAGYLSRPTITYDMGVVPAYGNSISFHISINMLRFLNMYANKRATRVVTISRYLATKMSWYLPLNKIDVIHCGVDQLKKEYIKNLTKVEARNFLGLPQEFPIILTVGRLAPEARYKNVVGLAKELDKIGFFKTGGHLIAVGNGPQEEFDRLRKYKVTVLGALDEKNLAYAYLASDIYASASLWEGFNLPLLEAQLCGLPALALNICSHPEVIFNNDLLASSVSDLALKIDNLLKDKIAREQIATKSTAWAKQFTWERTARGFVNSIYSALDI